MKKIAVSAVIFFTLSSLFLSPFTSSGAITSSATLNFNGTVQYNNLSYGTPIKKGLIAYTYLEYESSIDRAFVGNTFSLLDIYLDDSASALQSVKNTNPNTKILGYKSLIAEYTFFDDWTVVNSHEDWFVHDAKGKRITNNEFGFYLMDVSSGWKQHWIDYVNSKLNLPAGTYYSGVFVDDVYRELNSAVYSSPIPASVLSNWKTKNIEMLQSIKSNLSNKVVFINTDEMLTDDYLSVVDGQLIEGYEHAPWNSVDSYSNGGLTLDTLARKSATNKIIWAASGTVVSSDTTKMANMVKYCYASFLIANSGTQTYWSFNNYGSQDGSKGYYPIMDTNIGQATGTYYQSQNIYMRDYTNGLVLFNPTNNAYTITLTHSYRLTNGQTVTSINLGPTSAEILLN